HRHLTKDGVLVVHVTNVYLNLVPVVISAADTLGYSAYLSRSMTDAAKGTHTTKYLTLAPPSLDQEIRTALGDASRVMLAPGKRRLWTDNFSSLLSVIKWR